MAFESGLFLNDILDMKLYTIGIGAVYRYGTTVLIESKTMLLSKCP